MSDENKTLKTETRKSKMLTRELTLSLDKREIDEEARTVDLTFSSEAEVERYWGREVLDHSPGACDLSYINDGGPLLMDHNSRDQVGVVEEARLDSKARVNRAKVRFGRSARAQEIFQDVIEGIRRKVSCSYRILEEMVEKVGKGDEVHRATKWRIHEISLVSLPADSSVGVGRSEEFERENEILVRSAVVTSDRTASDQPRNEKRIMDENEQSGTAPAPAQKTETASEPKTSKRDATETGSSGASVTIQLQQAKKEELRRITEINGIARRMPHLAAQAEKAVNDGLSADEFRRSAFETLTGAQPIQTPAAPEVGMGNRDLRQYSVCRAILAAKEARHTGKRDGLEWEVSREVANKLKQDPDKMFLPWDIMSERRDYSESRINAVRHAYGMRALTTSSAASAGNLVATELLAGSLIELLRNRMVTANLGATMLSGLVGDIAIPRHDGTATVYWLDQTASGTRSDQTFSQLTLTPHRLMAATAFSKNLLAQASVDVENMVRSDLMSALAVEKDRAALDGSGVGAEPTGIWNTGSMATLSFSVQSTPTWAEIIAYETSVADANADIGNLAYVGNPTARGKLKATAKSAVASGFIWEPDPLMRPGFGMVNGYPAVASLQVPSDANFGFGAWNDLVIADWAGIEIETDHLGLILSGQIQVVATNLCDVGLRHVGSFTVASNSIT